MRSIRDIIAERPLAPIGTTLIYIGTRPGSMEAHSTARVADDDVVPFLWAVSAEGEYAEAWLPQGVEPITNFWMLNKFPPEHMRDRVETFMAERNYCRDCLHHKQNLTGACGCCGAGA